MEYDESSKIFTDHDEEQEKSMKAYKLSCKRGPIHRIIGQLSLEEKKKTRQYLEKIFSQARRELGLDNDSLPFSEE
jgi:hypothetical protein